MSAAPTALEHLEVDSRQALWKWLQEHHRQAESVLLVTFKKSVRDKFVSREDVLDTLVAFGWTDGRRWAVDEQRTMQLISPRRTLVWAASYKRRADRLIREHLMQPAGLDSMEAAHAAGLWHVSDPLDALQIPEDLKRALESSEAAMKYWWTCSLSYRRNVLRWLSKARTQATRERRVLTIFLACRKMIRIKNF